MLEEMISRGQGRLRKDAFSMLVTKLELVDSVTTVEACRDPEDDKFIGCAIDSKSLYIVSGDKDLLALGDYDGIEMITAADFCERYL